MNSLINQFLNLFDVHDQPVALRVLRKLMSWVITNSIYIICLANSFPKLMTVTMKSNIDVLVFKEVHLECLEKMFLSCPIKIAVYTSIGVCLLQVCILQNLEEV